MDPRKRRTMDALLRAAEAIFSELPEEEVTVEQIAERAGVAVGSIYNHFGSKSGLRAAVVERALAADRQHMDRAYVADRTPLEQIRAAGEEYLAFYLRNPEYFRMLAFPGEPGSYPAGHELAARLADAVEEQNARLVAALRAGIEVGELRAVDPEQTAMVLWAAWNGVLSLGWRPDRLRRDEPQLRALIATATDVVTHGLAADPKPERD